MTNMDKCSLLHFELIKVLLMILTLIVTTCLTIARKGLHCKIIHTYKQTVENVLKCLANNRPQDKAIQCAINI